MESIALDRTVAMPLHEQLYVQFRSVILRQNLVEETLLPREIDIAETLGLSRGTVRHAISKLVQEGLVYRTSGRGTFVRAHKADYSLSSLAGFTQQMHLDGRTPSSRVVAVAVEDGARSQSRVPLPKDAKRVLRIERIRMSDEEPVSLETLWLPYPRFAGLQDYDLAAHSVYTALEEDFGVALKGGTFTLDIELLVPDVAALLEESPGAPVFTMTGSVCDMQDQPVVWVQSRYRPTHFSFHLELPRLRGGDRSTFELKPRAAKLRDVG